MIQRASLVYRLTTTNCHIATLSNWQIIMVSQWAFYRQS